MCFFHEQAVKHETPTIAPLPRDDVLDRTTCVNVIKMSIGPLIWRLLSNMHRHAGMLSSSGLHGSRDVLLADKLGGGGSEQRGNGHRVDAGTTKRTAMNKKQRAWDEPPRMFIFSGHDSTITPLLLALGLPETKWPKFASRQVLIVRMRSDSKSIACMHRMFLIRTYISCHGHLMGPVLCYITFILTHSLSVLLTSCGKALLERQKAISTTHRLMRAATRRCAGVCCRAIMRDFLPEITTLLSRVELSAILLELFLTRKYSTCRIAYQVRMLRQDHISHVFPISWSVVQHCTVLFLRPMQC